MSTIGRTSEEGARAVSDATELKREGRRWWATGIVIAVVVVLGIGGYLLFRPSSGGRPAPTTKDTRTTVASFSGTGDKTTPTFKVREGWQIQWKNTGKSFSFAITGDRDFGTVINQKKPGSGVTSPVGSGKFRLNIKAVGGWSIQILQP